jgi:hypothetical protein
MALQKASGHTCQEKRPLANVQMPKELKGVFSENLQGLKRSLNDKYVTVKIQRWDNDQLTIISNF